MNIFRRIMGRSDAPDEPNSSTGGVNETRFEDTTGAESNDVAIEELSLVHEGIELESTGPVAGLRSDGELAQAIPPEPAPIGTSTEMVDDWSTSGASVPSDPDQPVVLGGLYNPPSDPAAQASAYDDAHEITMDVHVGAAPPPPEPPADIVENDAPETMKIDGFLKVPDIPGGSSDAFPLDGTPNDELAGESPGDVSGMNKADIIEPLAKSFDPPSDDAEAGYLAVELRSAMVSSYEVGPDDEPSTLVDLSEASRPRETAAQSDETDYRFLSSHAQAVANEDEFDEPEI